MCERQSGLVKDKLRKSIARKDVPAQSDGVFIRAEMFFYEKILLVSCNTIKECYHNSSHYLNATLIQFASYKARVVIFYALMGRRILSSIFK
jgi:hypothetical protein